MATPWLLWAIVLITVACHQVSADTEFAGSQDLDIAMALPLSNYWMGPGYIDPNNSTLAMAASMGCSSCGEIFYHEPPPDDIIFIPSPPMHPGLQSSLAETIKLNKQQDDQCSFCNVFTDETEQLANLNGINRSMGNGFVFILAPIVIIASALFLYWIGMRKPRIIPSFARTSIFKSSHDRHNGHQHHINKNNPLVDTMPRHPGVNMSDPCYLQTNREKNLSSPIISDHVSHKKTAIPSKCWAQPGSIVNRTVRRVPNEYEIPSSQTNSTGTSSAFYADVSHDHRNNQAHNNNARFFSPYNLHTYAEVREVLDSNEHFHTSSNSSAMLSESNYDNALYPHQGNMAIQNVPNGSVQMSDFNLMRPAQSVAYQPQPQMGHHPTLKHLPEANMSHGQPIYEQPQHQQRAQVIITSSNQGVNPAILSHHDRIHNVI